MRYTHDFLVIGGGVAGLTCALRLAKSGTVAVLAKRGRAESSTNYAQGGIAAVSGPGDSFDQHVADTLEAGAGLCREEAVRVTVEEGPDRVRELIELGAEFTRDESPSGFHLTREGGHSQRRILHAADLTGREVERALLHAIAEAKIPIFEDHAAVDLITVSKLRQSGNAHLRASGKAAPGAGRSVSASNPPPADDRVLGCYVLAPDGQVNAFLAKAVILATGGAGKVYLYTTNPDVATGDGIAMAHRAGAAIANMEFIQFHPTCLFHPHAKSFLISEALRGEGGILRNQAGEAFMGRYDVRKELAPRDIVARSIDSELKRRGDDCVYLDMTHLPKAFLLEHFPNIYANCQAFGIDLAVQPIPVVPGTHYTCGGVATDLRGQTTLAGLLAIGETACTGLHGANRLASNSLLEGLVFGHRAADRAVEVAREASPALYEKIPDWDPGAAVTPDEGVVVKQNWDEIRNLMWNYVGIVRTDKRLERAQHRLDNLLGEIDDYYWGYLVTRDLLELRNLADVARLIVACAQERKESRGLHSTLSHPERDDAHCLRDTVLVRGKPAPEAWPRPSK